MRFWCNSLNVCVGSLCCQRGSSGVYRWHCSLSLSGFDPEGQTVFDRRGVNREAVLIFPCYGQCTAVINSNVATQGTAWTFIQMRWERWPRRSVSTRLSRVIKLSSSSSRLSSCNSISSHRCDSHTTLLHHLQVVATYVLAKTCLLTHKRCFSPPRNVAVKSNIHW